MAHPTPLTRLISVPVCLLMLSAAGCGTDDRQSDAASTPSSPSSQSAKAPTNSASAEAGGTTDTLVEAGISQAQSGDLAAAETTFRNVLLIDADNGFALYNLGLIAQTNADTSTAIEYYDQALALNPSYTPALYNKAIALEPSDLDEASALYRQILIIDPGASTTYLRLSSVYERQGRSAAAAKARKKALVLNPSLAEVTIAPAE